MRNPATIIENWCASGRRALREGFTVSGTGSSNLPMREAWRAHSSALRRRCLTSLRTQSGSVRVELLGALLEAEQAIGQALSVVDMPPIVWMQRRIRPLDARETAENAISRVAAMQPLVRPTRTARRTKRDLVTVSVAVAQFHVSARTLRRNVALGRLKDYRSGKHAPNALLQLDRAAIRLKWPARR